MVQLRHLFPSGTAQAQRYIYPRKVGSSEFKVPARDDRNQHASDLIRQVEDAEQQSQSGAALKPAEKRPEGIVLDFRSDPGFKLQLQSLEMQRSGIELLNSRVISDIMHATVFIPEGKIDIFVRKLEAYAHKDTPQGLPRNKDFAESITEIRLGVLKSFWTDSREFPEAQHNPLWWEVWLREQTNPQDVSEQFRDIAQSLGIDVNPHEIRFPERRVLLARATPNQWTQFETLFDILAELRLAKWLAGDFVNLPPRDQAAWIEEALTRIQPPPQDAPAVCHLDTGVNRGHPLLALALAEENMLAYDPNWLPTDHRDGHGTAMAGVALYGCLTTLFEGRDQILLRHCLESVKILPDQGRNDPDLYGAITDQAMSRAEIASPHRNRVFCLAITADSRDDGFPSSWSGAIDRACAGVEDSHQRLVCVSAGNTPLDGRHDYPYYNYTLGVEDPAQAWNVLTVHARGA